MALAIWLAAGTARAEKPEFWFPVGEKLIYKIKPRLSDPGSK